MGILHYGAHEQFTFTDDVLTHLRTVIIAKFVQQESFIFTWLDERNQRSIWLHPTHAVTFEFCDAEVPPVRREWVTELMGLANSPTGLRLTIA